MILVAQTFNTSDPLVHDALAAGDRGWVEQCLHRQIAAGVDYVEVNASSFVGAEESVLRWLTEVVETAGTVPVSLDSADPDVLAAVGKGRRRAPLLNSVDAAPPWPGDLVSLVRDGASLVVQLRRGRELPPDATTRLDWAADCVAELDRLALPLSRVWIDPVLLPWGADLAAGEAVLTALGECRRRWPELTRVVGLSNVSYGHPDRRALHQAWLPRLQAAGLSAVILDPFHPQLMAMARGGRPG